METSSTTLKGCYDLVEIAGEDKTMLFMGANSTLYYPNAAMNIGAFRAYFQLTGGLTCVDPQGINSYALNFGDDATGIKEIGNILPEFSSTGSSWFTLDGRQLNGKPTQKGIYIHNAKKTVID